MKRKSKRNFESDDDSGSDWEDISTPEPVLPPPLVVLPLLELPKSPTPPPSPATSEPD